MGDKNCIYRTKKIWGKKTLDIWVLFSKIKGSFHPSIPCHLPRPTSLSPATSSSSSGVTPRRFQATGSFLTWRSSTSILSPSWMTALLIQSVRESPDTFWEKVHFHPIYLQSHSFSRHTELAGTGERRNVGAPINRQLRFYAHLSFHHSEADSESTSLVMPNRSVRQARLLLPLVSKTLRYWTPSFSQCSFFASGDINLLPSHHYCCFCKNL